VAAFGPGECGPTDLASDLLSAVVRGNHEGGNMASSIGINAGSDRGADYRGRSTNLEKNKDHKSLKQRRSKALA